MLRPRREEVCGEIISHCKLPTGDGRGLYIRWNTLHIHGSFNITGKCSHCKCNHYNGNGRQPKPEWSCIGCDIVTGRDTHASCMLEPASPVAMHPRHCPNECSSGGNGGGNPS